jgi:hypothetical protein
MAPASSAGAFNQFSNLSPGLVPNQASPHGPQIETFNGTLQSDSSFHLRAADWSDKRKVENGASGVQHQQPVMDSQ